MTFEAEDGEGNDANPRERVRQSITSRTRSAQRPMHHWPNRFDSKDRQPGPPHP